MAHFAYLFFLGKQSIHTKHFKIIVQNIDNVIMAVQLSYFRFQDYKIYKVQGE